MASKTKNVALAWLSHYSFGLFAQTFNGTVTTAVALIAEATSGKLPEGVTFANTWHTLAIAMLGYALMYFHAHPFPDDYTAITTTTSVTSAGIQPVPAGVVVASAIVAPPPIVPSLPVEPVPATAASRMNAAAQ
jgi:hypothetical protein